MSKSMIQRVVCALLVSLWWPAAWASEGDVAPRAAGQPGVQAMSLQTGGTLFAPTSEASSQFGDVDGLWNQVFVSLHFVVHDHVAVGVGYANGTQYTPDAFLDGSLVVNTLWLSGRALYEVLPFLTLFAEQDLGLDHARVRYSLSEGRLRDSAWSPVTYTSLGADISLHLGAYRVGFVTQHGYRWTHGWAMDNARFANSDARPLDLGTLRARGYQGRFGISLGVVF